MKDINYRLYKLLKLMCIVEKLALQKLQITNSGTTVKSTQQFTKKRLLRIIRHQELKSTYKFLSINLNEKKQNKNLLL